MSKVRIYAGAVALCLLSAMPLVAQAPSLADMYAKIKSEETNNSKIMWIIHEVADVHGPRVTGTPGLKAADDWAVATMKSWGLQNVHLEPWTFQPPSAAVPAPGWDNLLLQADAVKPFHGQVMVKPLAWTPGTAGPVTSVGCNSYAARTWRSWRSRRGPRRIRAADAEQLTANLLRVAKKQIGPLRQSPRLKRRFPV